MNRDQLFLYRLETDDDPIKIFLRALEYGVWPPKAVAAEALLKAARDLLAALEKIHALTDSLPRTIEAAADKRNRIRELSSDAIHKATETEE